MISLFVLFYLAHSNVGAESKVWFYMDGQEQRYVGNPMYLNGEWSVPLRPILMEASEFHPELSGGPSYVQKIIRTLNEERMKEADDDLLSSVESRLLEESNDGEKMEVELERERILLFMEDFTLNYVNRRDMIRLADIPKLGFDYYVYEEERMIHVNSPGLGELAGLSVSMSHKSVTNQFSQIHWNTGFAKKADYYGFYGTDKDFSYQDKYGYERVESVYDLQLEMTEGRLSHLIVSTDLYPTSKGIRVGDRVNDAIRTYGSQFVRETMDGKQVIIYDVEFGSIWFIANRDQMIERIGYWDHHVRGFGEVQEEEIEESEST